MGDCICTLAWEHCTDLVLSFVLLSLSASAFATPDLRALGGVWKTPFRTAVLHREGTGKTSLLPADRIALSLRKQKPEFIWVIALPVKSFMYYSTFHFMATNSATGGFMASPNLQSGCQSHQRWVEDSVRQVNTWPLFDWYFLGAVWECFLHQRTCILKKQTIFRILFRRTRMVYMKSFNFQENYARNVCILTSLTLCRFRCHWYLSPS